jgi:hypothetical protein
MRRTHFKEDLPITTRRQRRALTHSGYVTTSTTTTFKVCCDNTTTLSTTCDDEKRSESNSENLSGSVGSSGTLPVQDLPGMPQEDHSEGSWTVLDITDVEEEMHQIERSEAEIVALEEEIQQLEEERRRMKLRQECCRQRIIEVEKQVASQKASVALKQGGGPVNWGISVQQLQDFAESISNDLREYCIDHRCEPGSWKHVCLKDNCDHRHGCADYRPRRPNEDPTKLALLEPNMHTVVKVFIQPKTMDQHGFRGLALTLNQAQPKKVEKFVSHSWTGRFEDFVAALTRNLLPENVVFICSCALPQNLDVAPILGTCLEQTPFALAHDLANEVWLVIDQNIDVIDRAWVVYELYLSLCRGKHLHIAATEKGADFRKKIMGKVHSFDLASTDATKASDLESIMDAISGEEHTLNKQIKEKLAVMVHQLAASE